MHILLINHYAGGGDLGMEYRPNSLAKAWIEMGHQVTVIAADYSHLRLKNPVVERDLQKLDVDGVDTRFIKTPIYRGNGRSRAWNMAVFIWKLFRKAPHLAGELKPDLVIASSTYPFDIYPALKIARKANAKTVYEIHDLWPLTLVELYGYSWYHPMILLIRAAEKTALRSSSAIVSALPGTDQYLKERGYDGKPYFCIQNGIDTQENWPVCQLPLKHMELLKRFREKGCFLVMYVGSMGKSNALEYFVQAAAAVPSNVVCVMVGTGPDKNSLSDLAEQLGSNLLFLDPIGRDQIQAVLKFADCLYLGARKSSLYRYGVSMNKIFDYMLAAKPVLFGVEACNNPIKDAGCGITIPPEDSGAIARAIAELQGMEEEERKAMGCRGKSYCIEKHDYKVLAQAFLDGVSSI